MHRSNKTPSNPKRCPDCGTEVPWKSMIKSKIDGIRIPRGGELWECYVCGFEIFSTKQLTQTKV